MFEHLVTREWHCFGRLGNLTGGSRSLGAGLEVQIWSCFPVSTLLSGLLRYEKTHHMSWAAPNSIAPSVLCCSISNCDLRENVSAFIALVKELVKTMKEKAKTGHHQDTLTSSPLPTAPLATVSDSGFTTSVPTVPVHTRGKCKS